MLLKLFAAAVAALLSVPFVLSAVEPFFNSVPVNELAYAEHKLFLALNVLALCLIALTIAQIPNPKTFALCGIATWWGLALCHLGSLANPPVIVFAIPVIFAVAYFAVDSFFNRFFTPTK